ncbi:hypothetical protein BGZ70_010686 [Mortierella alpina]|uniref:Uncharacterized protein n=1 Tax=Mortierella alpina TaxID=64518 RepID=A0A9P6IYN2_MORAP|nr:hypothetical protein BGZ70_010686 [Mortierella alpina]
MYIINLIPSPFDLLLPDSNPYLASFRANTSPFTMKFSLFHFFTLVACVIAVFCVGAEAKKASVACQPGSDLELFCTKTSAELDLMLEEVFETIPFEEPGREMGTTAERRRQGLARRASIFTEIKDYFMNYWHNLKLIFSGKFGEGIFKQLKNSGSWCEKDNWIVKAVKGAINAMSGGALTGICDCLYPIIKKYDTYQDLFHDISGKGFSNVLAQCPANFKDQIKEAIKKTGAGLIKSNEHPKNGKNGKNEAATA